MLTQTRLNISPSGQLIFYRPNTLPNYPFLDRPIPWPKLCCHNDTSILKASELNARVPLLQLPDELLQPILRSVVKKPLEFSLGHDAYWDAYWHLLEEDDVPNWGPERGWARYAAAYNLIWTCKRFHALALPLLYGDVSIDISIHWIDCPPQAKLFREEILRRPLLQNYIKHLAIGRQSPNSEMLKIACTLPRLDKLSLDMVQEEEEPDISLIKPTKDQEKSASFTKLQFHGLHARPQSIKQFLQWPKELHELFITNGDFWDNNEIKAAFRWNHNCLADALSSQKDHIRVLDIGWLGHDRDQNAFPVSNFPNLHTMTICIAYKHPNEEACRNWLTPSLQTLILNLHTSGQCGPSSHNCMSKANSHAIAEWARMARRWVDETRNLGLREICIRAYSSGDDAWQNEDEVSCMHGSYAEEMKENLRQCLKYIDEQGFKSFWIGYSGRRYTSETMEAMCKCEKKHKPRA
ncbi:hypothetical protein EDB82DRAFT_498057 [Fusarium venenatum]|uniref:uncharacterized protein n=1 Tax=Fusarium venenatum TaxID=56646 RepID=UPI001D77764A|nr:hypothetical protein EDB82DRAFT_498057 [Fusarium venenatum]